jgi:hypothetical protein
MQHENDEKAKRLEAKKKMRLKRRSIQAGVVKKQARKRHGKYWN